MAVKRVKATRDPKTLAVCCVLCAVWVLVSRFHGVGFHVVSRFGLPPDHPSWDRPPPDRPKFRAFISQTSFFPLCSGCRVKPRRPQRRRGFTRKPESPHKRGHLSFFFACAPSGVLLQRLPKPHNLGRRDLPGSTDEFSRCSVISCNDARALDAECGTFDLMHRSSWNAKRNSPSCDRSEIATRAECCPRANNMGMSGSPCSPPSPPPFGQKPFGAPTLPCRTDCETTKTHILGKNGLAKNGGFAQIGFGQNWLWPKLAGPKHEPKMDWPKTVSATPPLPHFGQRWPRPDIYFFLGGRGSKHNPTFTRCSEKTKSLPPSASNRCSPSLNPAPT